MSATNSPKDIIKSVKEGKLSRDNLIRALTLIVNMSGDPKNQEEVRQYGGIDMLLTILENKDSDEGVVMRSVGALLNLSTNEENRIEVRTLQGLPLIVNLLQHTNATIRQYAAGALNNLASNDENKSVLLQHSAIPKIFELLHHKDSDNTTKQYCVNFICTLSSDEPCAKSMISHNAAQQIVTLCLQNGASEEMMVRGVGALSNLMIVAEDKTQFIKINGLLDNLLECLQSSNFELVSNAAICFAVLSVEDYIAKLIVDKHGLEHIIGVFLGVDGEMELLSHLAVAIWNIANNAEYRTLVRSIDTGVFEKLPSLLMTEGISDDTIERMIGCIFTLAIDEENSVLLQQHQAIEAIAQYLSLQQFPVTVVENALVAIGIFTYVESNRSVIASSGAVEQILQLVHTAQQDENLLDKATGVLLNASNEETSRTIIRQHNGVQVLVELLDHSNPSVVHNAAGCLWNLSQDHDDTKHEIKEHGGLKKLLDILQSEVGKRKATGDSTTSAPKSTTTSSSSSKQPSTTTASQEQSVRTGPPKNRATVTKLGEEPSKPSTTTATSLKPTPAKSTSTAQDDITEFDKFVSENKGFKWTTSESLDKMLLDPRTLNSFGRVVEAKDEFAELNDEITDKTIIAYAKLENLSGPKRFPSNLDVSNREKYLSEEEFVKYFKMKKADFAKLPPWKKSGLKKELGLF